MKYEVVLADRADRQLTEISEWHARHAPDIAARWFNGFVEAVISLEENPDRFGLAHESAEFPTEIREMLYGVGRRKTHRAIFTIRPDKVVVHAIRHLSQRDLTPDDLVN